MRSTTSYYLLLLLLSLLVLENTSAFTIHGTRSLAWKQRAAYATGWKGLSAKTFDTDDDRDDKESQQQQQQAQRRTVVVAIKNDDLPSQRRTVRQVEKFTRLPFWPAWNGVFIFLVSKLLGDDAGAQLEDWAGGRVCPNFYRSDQIASPFLMLVHHRHSFAPWDPFRLLQSTFFPEGFPAHPHRGFITVTYFLKGGFVHRDSIGVKQVYGAEEHHNGKHTQWLNTGAGLLHEEMFDITPDKGGIGFLQPSSQELFQLWLNIPSYAKMKMPATLLLGGEDAPTVVTKAESGDVMTETVVLAGTYQGATSAAPTISDVAIFHVTMKSGSTWRHELPSSFRTVIIYVRTGSISVDETRIPVHHTAYMNPSGTNLVIDTETGGDFLVLAGEPLKEPVAAQGSMVMNTYDEIDGAYNDYQLGKMGVPWDHKLTDDEWKAHVAKFPSIYRQQH